MPRTPVDIVERFLTECWGKGDLKSLPQLIHPDYAVDGERVGPAWVATNITTFRRAFPDLSLTTVEGMAMDESVACLVRLQGTHQGEWKGIPATGRQVDYREAGFWRVQDGMIVCGTFVAESLTLRVQLGQIPAEVWTGTKLSADQVE